MNIFVDFDDVIGDLVGAAWLPAYNADWNDTLTKDKIRAWDISKFVKPECGTKIYSYLGTKDLYSKVVPFDGALSGIEYLRSLGHRVIIATTGGYEAKRWWLETHKVDIGQFAQDFVCTGDKSLLRGDMLIDDRPENIVAFGVEKSILVDQPWNQEFIWPNRVHNWHEITYMIARHGGGICMQ